MLQRSVLAAIALAGSVIAAPASSSSDAVATSTASSAASSSSSSSSSLDDICTAEYIQSVLPANDTLLGIEFITDSVTASVATSSSYEYCNVSFAYTHTGKGDEVNVIYGLPSPDDFENRFYLAGGGGYSLNTDATGGLEYGAASGATDAGYDAFTYSYDEVNLYGNGSINWDAAYMFAYQALGELTKIGKPLSRNFYGLASDAKIYTYFEGCSDGGREAMSQVQRWGEEYDGVVAGAPAFRFSQQQVQHVFSSAVEYIQGYYPPTCELDKIVNATIAACDPLDGREDGVISRTDLCQLHFNLSSIIGESYYCAAESSSSLGFGFSKRAEGSEESTTPEQNGTVTAEGVAVVQAILDGLHDSNGERAYLSWQIGSDISDADPTYNDDTEEWELNIPSTGGAFVARYIQLLDIDNLSNLDNVTYDTLVDWMRTGYWRYLDSLQTTVTDLRPFRESGGKLIHYHGESDPSIPAGSSVHYYQAVQEALYGKYPADEAHDLMDDWYQFYLIPGAAHCGSNSLQPGPYPEDNMATMIEWVESGVKPAFLNATVSSGYYSGEVQELCKWPLRPLWSGNATYFDCVYDQASIESWTYTFDAFKTPVF